MSLVGKVVGAIGWEIVGKVGGQGAGLLFTLILARMLTPDEFGLFAIVSVFVAVAAVFVDMGFGSALVQRSSVTEDHYDTVFVANTVIGVVLMLVVMLVSSGMERFFADARLNGVLLAIAPIFVINAVGSVGRSRLYRQMDFAALNVSALAGTIIGGVVAVALAFAGAGVWSLVVQTLATALVVTIYTYWRAAWLPRFRLQGKCLSDLWGYGWRIFVSTSIGAAFAQADKLIIGRTSSAAQLGYYYRARSLESIIQNVLSQSVLSALFPSLSAMQNDQVRFGQTARKLFTVLGYLSISLSGFLFVTAHDLVLLLFSEQWRPSVAYFRIIAVAFFAYPIAALLNTILASKGHAAEFLKLTQLRYAILLPAYVALYSSGIEVFLYTHVGLTILSLGVSLWYLTGALGVGLGGSLRLLLEPMIIALPAVLLVEWVNILPSSGHLVRLLVLGVCYSALCWLGAMLVKPSGFTTLILMLRELRGGRAD